MMRRSAAAVAVAAALMLTGCADRSAPGAQACIDWVLFDAPADAAADADAVVRGRILEQNGSAAYEGMAANVWRVAVDEWISGAGGPEIDVISLPRSCGDTGDSFARFDPDHDVFVFLRSSDEGWQAVTPWQGAVLADADGGIPSSWPDDLYE